MRVAGPLLTSNVFVATASREVDADALNFRVVFYLLAASALLAAALGRLLPESIAEQDCSLEECRVP